MRNNEKKKINTKVFCTIKCKKKLFFGLKRKTVKKTFINLFHVKLSIHLKQLKNFRNNSHQ